MFVLEDVLAKDPSELTQEERDFLAAQHAEGNVSDEDATKFGLASEEGDDLGEDEEKALSEMVEKALEGAVGKSAEKAAEKLADQMVAKFMKRANGARAKVLGGGAPAAAAEDQDEVRSWLKALAGRDVVALKTIEAKTISRSKYLGTSTSDTPKAGYLIPTALETEVLRILGEQYGIARRLFRYIPFNGPGNTRSIPRLGNTVAVSWVNEGAAKPATQPTFALVTQTLKKLAAIVPLTEELLEDSGIDLKGLVSELFAEAIAKEEDTQFFMGTGSPWTGIFKSTAVTEVKMASGDVDDITIAHLMAVLDAAPSSVRNGSNSRWLISPTVLSKIRLLKSGDVYIFRESWDGGTASRTLLGYPVEISDIFPSATAGNAVDVRILAFGDFQQAAIYGDKGGMRVVLLDQATITDVDGSTAINLAQQDMVALRVVRRVGYVLAQPTAVVVLETAA